jgi:Tail-tube assembly protein
MPVGWDDQTNNDYQDQSMTELLGGLGLVSTVVSSISQAFHNGELSKDTGAVVAELVGKVLARGSLVGDAGALAQAGIQAMGYAMNPQFEVLYNRTQFREFQFTFTLTPRNRNEAEEIFNIINIFKFHASPEYIQSSGRYLIPPSFFDITFRFNGAINPRLPRISTCVCKNVTVSYAPGTEAFATFDDGHPVQIQLVMTFGELEIIHKGLRDPKKTLPGDTF